MNSSDSPSRIVKAFGVNGLKNTIPTDSSESTDNNGIATFDKGFPPITMQPLSAGGIPPSGKDVNGALYSVTLQQQWQNAGMSYQFNQQFSDAINGYPKGSIVLNSSSTGQWLNLNESNSTPPESSSGSSTGWVPLTSYGVTSLALSSGSIVLNSIQASKKRIILSGTLTSNLNIIFPSWIKSWIIDNKCNGNFSVTCKTSSGSGVQVLNGTINFISCDGVNISYDFGSASQRNVGEMFNNIPSMESFASTKQQTGSQRLPGGIILKWIYVSASTGTSGSVSIPEPFPNELFCAFITDVVSPGNAPSTIGVTTASDKNTIFWQSSSQAPGNFNIFAIGR